MIVDLVTDKGINWMRYETDCIPRIGETISTLKPEEASFLVLSVDHLIGSRFNSDEMRQDLVTVIAREIDSSITGD